MANVIKKPNYIGMISLFPTKQREGWLVCNGSITDSKRLVKLLRDEAYEDSSRKFSILFTKPAKWYHPLNKSSKYWILNTMDYSYCIWYSVENTGYNPCSKKKDLQIDLPMNADIMEVTKITYNSLKEIIEVEQQKIKLIFRQSIYPNTPLNVDAGIQINIMQTGYDIKEHPYWDKDEKKARLPDLDGGIYHCSYMIKI